MTLRHKAYGTVYLINHWVNTHNGIAYGGFTTAIYGNFVCLPLSEVIIITE